MILYKYVPFDENSLNIITEHTLKYSAPNNFNEPFDCLANYDRQQLKDYFSNEYHKIGKISLRNLLIGFYQKMPELRKR